jgi:secreted PhoX family phosphatase
MRFNTVTATLSAVLCYFGFAQGIHAAPTVKSVEFIGMSPPSTVEERADIYTQAQMKVAFTNGKSKTFDLKYHLLMGTTDIIKKQVVGGLFNVKESPLMDEQGQMASDAPDGTSLLKIPGMRADQPEDNRALALVTQFEYREVPPNYPNLNGKSYVSFWSKLPATMGLAKLDQDKRTGALEVVDYDHISFADVNGGWIHCAASLSPWNTHLSAEEYEPDAKTREGIEKTSDTDDTTDINSFSQYYFGEPATANPYHYGVVPEVTVNRRGNTSVVKHYAMGRIARELADVQPDEKTAYMGDDGAYTGMFMFVADKPKDLSAGTLYAAKWIQTSADNGGSANLSWIRLGHATDAEIKSLVDDGMKFSKIFEVANKDPGDPSFKKVKTYMGTEWLKLKPGMEKAAAFLETRRYAALLGATTEFSKMEGVTHNARDKKAYVVISRVEVGMTDIAADPQNDVRLPRNDAGAIYELTLRDGQKDTNGNAINSVYVAASMTSIPELLGGWLGFDTDGKTAIKDSEGNRCKQDKVCGGDNIKYAENIRTLFVGEDTSRRNNNYVWAFNVDTRKLSRILSVPLYAEATGLQAVEDLNGFGYIMSNFQHPGEEGQKGEFKGAGTITEAAVLGEIDAKWNNRKKAAIGYIGTVDGALPALK